MKFKEYVEALNTFLEQNSQAEEYEVVTSIDDEGNSHNRVYFKPSLGYYDDYEDFYREGYVDQDNNAVCVN